MSRSRRLQTVDLLGRLPVGPPNEQPAVPAPTRRRHPALLPPPPAGPAATESPLDVKGPRTPAARSSLVPLGYGPRGYGPARGALDYIRASVMRLLPSPSAL